MAERMIERCPTCCAGITHQCLSHEGHSGPHLFSAFCIHAAAAEKVAGQVFDLEKDEEGEAEGMAETCGARCYRPKPADRIDHASRRNKCTLMFGHSGDHLFPCCQQVLAEQDKAAAEKINHPSHYGGDTSYEAIKVIHAWGLNFALGSVVKYVCRAGRKRGEPELDDLRKARWYLNWEIKQREQRQITEGA